MAPYRVNGVLYQPREQPHYDEVGIATWYGAQYNHQMTSDGELFDMDRPSAAHTTLPLPSIVEVINLENGRRIRVRVNDRGPFVRGRIIDLSREGAKELGFYGRGSARVRVRYVGPAPRGGGGSRELAALDPPPSAMASVQAELARPSPGREPPVTSTSNISHPGIGPRVQAGAFADPANAKAAQTALQGLGQVSLLPLERGATTVWRVIVEGPPDEGAASLVSALAASGYPDAKVLPAS
jgi:rare lipoprotein A